MHGSTEEEQFQEETPDYAAAESHHSPGGTERGIAAPTKLVDDSHDRDAE